MTSEERELLHELVMTVRLLARGETGWPGLTIRERAKRLDEMLERACYFENGRPLNGSRGEPETSAAVPGLSDQAGTPKRASSSGSSSSENSSSGASGGARPAGA
jgi:hypothetical protein